MDWNRQWSFVYRAAIAKKSGKPNKAQKIEINHYNTKTKNYFYCRMAKKRPKQKKIYNKGKYKENEEKQDEIGRKEQIIYG